LPRHRYEGLRASEVADSAEANRAPLSYGPYRLGQWTAGEQLVLDRNPNYWRAAEGLPLAERLIYRFGGSPPALAAGVRNGECDLVPSGPGLAEAAAALAGDEAVEVYASAGTTLEMLLFNQQPAPGFAPLPGAALLAAPEGRQALAHCLDRTALAPPLAEPAGGTFLPAGHPWAATDLAAASFDPAAGRALLAAAGWADADADGVLDREGQPLALGLAAGPAGSAARERLLAAVQSQLRENCGIAAAPQTLTSGELVADWPDGVVFGRRFDLALFGWSVGAAPPCGLFLSEQIPGDSNPAGANAGGYAAADYDQACRRALAAFDQPSAAGEYQRAQQAFVRDLPALPLFFWPRAGLAHPGVVGYALDATSESELWNIEAVTRGE
jgi:peptide/nickel transport system substrate-binding protein